MTPTNTGSPPPNWSISFWPCLIPQFFFWSQELIQKWWDQHFLGNIPGNRNQKLGLFSRLDLHNHQFPRMFPINNYGTEVHTDSRIIRVNFTMTTILNCRNWPFDPFLNRSIGRSLSIDWYLYQTIEDWIERALSLSNSERIRDWTDHCVDDLGFNRTKK